MRRSAAVLWVLLLISGISYGQSIPFLWGHRWGVGGRAMGLGGAYTALSDDYAGLYYNPAGLGQASRAQVFGSVSHLMITDNATFMGRETGDESSYTKLNGLGVVLPLPTVQGSLVLGFGFHRTTDFDQSLYVTRVINTPGDSVTWSYDELETGGLSQATFGGSMEMGPGLFLGAGIHFWFGSDEYTWRFSELDEPYDLYTFSDFYETTYIKTSFVGLNFSAGLLYRVGSALRLGASIETPVTLTSTEEWEYSETTTWDDGVVTDDTTDSGTYDYKIRSPWRFRVGGALEFGPVLLSGDVEMSDYSQMKFLEDPAEAGSDLSDANLEIKRNYRNTVDYRLGAEVTIPSTPVKLRGGWGVMHSPLKDAPSSFDRTYLSLGGGVTLSDQVMLDAAYVRTEWNGPPDEVIEKEIIRATKIFISFSYLF